MIISDQLRSESGLFRVFIMVSLTIALSACGGGGDSDGNNTSSTSSEDDPTQPAVTASSQWGEMKWGEGKWGK